MKKEPGQGRTRNLVKPTGQFLNTFGKVKV